MALVGFKAQNHRQQLGRRALEHALEVETAAREAVDALNFYESTVGAYANEQRVHVLDALRRLREVLDA